MSDSEEWQVSENNDNSDGESIGSQDTTDDEEAGIEASPKQVKSKQSTYGTAPTTFVTYVRAGSDVKDIVLQPPAVDMTVVGGLSEETCHMTEQQPALPDSNTKYVKVLDEKTGNIYRALATHNPNPCENTVYVLTTVKDDVAAINAFNGGKAKAALSKTLAAKSQAWDKGKDELNAIDKKRFGIDKGAQVVLSSVHAKHIADAAAPKRKRKRAAQPSGSAPAKTSAEMSPLPTACKEEPHPSPKKKAKQQQAPKQLFPAKTKTAAVARPRSSKLDTLTAQEVATLKSFCAFLAAAAN